jgi:ribonuclease HII
VTRLTAGVDEAGRGPRRTRGGGRVILDPAKPIAGLMTPASVLHGVNPVSRITESAIAWSVVKLRETIDALNILQATPGNATSGCAPVVKPTGLIDGNRAPDLSGEVHTVAGRSPQPGDIGSIHLAKVSRDSTCADARSTPVRFDQHKGCPTPATCCCLNDSTCAIHRRFCRSVKRCSLPGR